jgi:hypothetical protein
MLFRYAFTPVDVPVVGPNDQVGLENIGPVQQHALVLAELSATAGADHDDLGRATLEAHRDLNISSADLVALTRLETLDVPAVLEHVLGQVLLEQNAEVAVALSVVLTLLALEVTENDTSVLHDKGAIAPGTLVDAGEILAGHQSFSLVSLILVLFSCSW